MNTYTYDATGVYIANQNGTVTSYLKDMHGNIAAKADSSGAKLEESYMNYDAYGNQWQGNTPDPFGYCGEYYDEESGLIYLRNRYYESETGRFITEDPYWNVGNMIYGDSDSKVPDISAIMQSSNLFVYCVNNPINLWDPSGFYDRDAVKEYIDEWWNDRNPEYYSYRTDCANFVSQCLIAGGIRKKSNWFSYRCKKEGFNPAGWFNNNEKYDWYISETWRLAQKQFEFFSNPYNGFIEGDVLQLWSIEGMEYNVKYSNIQVGDLMYFADRETRTIHHATIISKVENGKVYFAGHTNNRYEQDLSDYFDDEMVFIVRIRDAAINGYVN